jgi:translation initiation factor IF-1
MANLRGIGSTHQKKHVKNRYTAPKELIFKDKDEEYATIVASKGDARFEIILFCNNVSCIAKARGSLINGPKRQKINKDDIVLIQKDTSTSDTKYYIIHKYSPDDIKQLKNSGELAIFNKNNYDIQILFDGDVQNRKNEELEIDDNFIANI